MAEVSREHGDITGDFRKAEKQHKFRFLEQPACTEMLVQPLLGGLQRAAEVQHAWITQQHLSTSPAIPPRPYCRGAKAWIANTQSGSKSREFLQLLKQRHRYHTSPVLLRLFIFFGEVCFLLNLATKITAAAHELRNLGCHWIRRCN